MAETITLLYKEENGHQVRPCKSPLCNKSIKKYQPNEKQSSIWRKSNHHSYPFRTLGRNSLSKRWLKGPCPISCRSPEKWMEIHKFHSQPYNTHNYRSLKWKKHLETQKNTSKFYSLYIRMVNIKFRSLHENRKNKYQEAPFLSSKTKPITHLINLKFINSLTWKPVYT